MEITYEAAVAAVNMDAALRNHCELECMGLDCCKFAVGTGMCETCPHNRNNKDRRDVRP